MLYILKMSKKRPLTPQKLKKLFTILEREVLRSNVLNYSVYEKREPHFSKKARLPDLNFGVMLLLAEAAQQAVQRYKGLVDDVNVVDDGACTGEDAGNVVEHLADVQEGLISVAGAAVQIGHLLGFDGGIAGGHFHGRSSHGKIPFFNGVIVFTAVFRTWWRPAG